MARKGVGPRGGILKYPSFSNRGGEREGAGRKAVMRKTSSLPRLSIYQLRRASLLGVGARFTVTHGRLRLEGEVGQGEVLLGHGEGRVAIPLHQTACYLGGHRWWFRCLLCQARVAILYVDGSTVACTCCLKLRYPSQSMGWIERSHVKEAKARAQVARDGKGMHEISLVRLDKLIGEEQERRGALLEFLYSMIDLHEAAGPRLLASPSRDRRSD